LNFKRFGKGYICTKSVFNVIWIWRGSKMQTVRVKIIQPA